MTHGSRLLIAAIAVEHAGQLVFVQLIDLLLNGERGSIGMPLDRKLQQFFTLLRNRGWFWFDRLRSRDRTRLAQRRHRLDVTTLRRADIGAVGKLETKFIIKAAQIELGLNLLILPCRFTSEPDIGLISRCTDGVHDRVAPALAAIFLRHPQHVEIHQIIGFFL